jgi:hypothetical protein
VGGVALIFSIGAETYFHKLLGAFGEALVIAGFLALTVDRYIKWRTFREISHGVAEYLIGYQLPAGAQAKIKDLMSCTIIREDMDLHWRIMPSEEAGKVKVAVNLSFHVKNISSEDQIYQQCVFVEKQDKPVIEEMQCNSSDSSSCYRLKGTDVAHDRPGEPGVMEAVGPEITIKPNKDSDQPYYRMAARYSMVLPDEYSDVFAFGGSTLRVKISADVPDTLVFSPPDSDDAAISAWFYNKFYLPNQHLRVRWFKKTDIPPKLSAQ